MTDNGLYTALLIIFVTISIETAILLVKIEDVLERVKKLEQSLKEEEE